MQSEYDRTVTWLELKLPPAALVAICAALMYGVAKLTPGLTFAYPARSVAGLVVGVLGLSISFAGVLAFGKRGTTVNPMTPGAASVIVSHGVYRFSRNPMYLGFALFLAGWAAYLANVGAALMLPLFVAYMTRFQIRPEERALLLKFGGPFADYMSSVRRWI
jgi:protein-S-isoprenylcysteine O-methyltransferase Ste14